MPSVLAIYDKLVPGGWFSYSALSSEGTSGFAPHFRSAWNSQTPQYFCEKEWAEPVLKQLSNRYIPDPQWRFQQVRNLSQDDGYNPGSIHNHVDLCALKGQRQPGRVSI